MTSGQDNRDLLPNLGPRDSGKTGHRSLGGYLRPELPWRQSAKGEVRSKPIVLFSPLGKYSPNLGQREEQVSVETLIPQLAIEAFAGGILHRFAWPNKVQFDPPQLRPGVHIFGHEL